MTNIRSVSARVVTSCTLRTDSSPCGLWPRATTTKISRPSPTWEEDGHQHEFGEARGGRYSGIEAWRGTLLDEEERKSGVAQKRKETYFDVAFRCAGERVNYDGEDIRQRQVRRMCLTGRRFLVLEVYLDDRSRQPQMMESRKESG